MSHWTKSVVKIKRLDMVRRAAQKLGLTVEEGKDLTFKSQWAGTQKVDMIITGVKGGQVGIAQNEDGTFSTVMDSFMNPIATTVGNNCECLMQEYTAELTRSQVNLMGGMVTKETMMADGSLQIRVSVGG